MYVKGACYAARERTEEKLLGTYLYVGNALVQNHVSMEMLVQGAKKNYESADTCIILVQDLGFGEMFPSSGLMWTERAAW